MHYDEYLRVWFDRDISFEVGEELSAYIVSLPRLVTSRSNEKLRDDSRVFKKIDVKISVVERAIHNIGRDTNSQPNASKSYFHLTKTTQLPSKSGLQMTKVTKERLKLPSVLSVGGQQA